MCLKIFVDFIVMWNYLRNIKSDEHQLKYIYILFICTQDFYEIYEENKNIVISQIL